jgi:glycosyltransferase involved in cell wall biosynthesis
MLSVIVPNYNHAPFLKERLDSVFCQDFDDYEVILLDDFSTDDSRELLQMYQDHPKVAHILLNERNSGSTFQQWKKGIELAKGEYVWIAESDDVADPGFARLLIERLENDATLGIAYCQSLVINSSGVVTRDNVRHTYGFGSINWEKEFRMDGRRALVEFLQLKNIIPNASAVIFKKALIRRLDEVAKFRFAGDWLLWVEILKRGNLCYIPARLNYFRYHDQVSRNMNSIDKVSRYLQERYKILQAIERTDGISRRDLALGYEKVFKEWKKRVGPESIQSLPGFSVAGKLSMTDRSFLVYLLRTLGRRIVSSHR